MAKTGLMYSGNFADYVAGKGYLAIPADQNIWISLDDYYETPERVSEAYNLLKNQCDCRCKENTFAILEIVKYFVKRRHEAFQESVSTKFVIGAIG